MEPKKNVRKLLKKKKKDEKQSKGTNKDSKRAKKEKNTKKEKSKPATPKKEKQNKEDNDENASGSGSDSERNNSDEEDEEKETKVSSAVAERIYMAGAFKSCNPNPSNYVIRILKLERPDLIPDEKTLQPDECIVMDVYLRKKGEIRTNDILVMRESGGDDEDDKLQDKLVIASKYAEGRFGAIYVVKRVTPAGDERTFAMKTSLRQSEASAKRLAREIRAMESISGITLKEPAKNVVATAVYGSVLGIPYFLMDPLNFTLTQLRFDAPGGRFCLRCVYTIAQGLLMGIKDIHSKKWVHRDIKPENYLMKGSTWILIDLGDACLNKEANFVSPPDAITLPFMSLPGHRAVVNATKASYAEDIESWFYTVIDLIQPLTWRKQVEEADSIEAKQYFWKNLLTIMKNYPANIAKVGELIVKGFSYPYKEINQELVNGQNAKPGKCTCSMENKMNGKTPSTVQAVKK